PCRGSVFVCDRGADTAAPAAGPHPGRHFCSATDTTPRGISPASRDAPDTSATADTCSASPPVLPASAPTPPRWGASETHAPLRRPHLNRFGCVLHFSPLDLVRA